MKISSFDNSHGALPWPVYACATKASCRHNPGAFELQTFGFRHNSQPYYQKLVEVATARLYDDCTTRSIVHLGRYKVQYNT